MFENYFCYVVRIWVCRRWGFWDSCWILFGLKLSWWVNSISILCSKWRVNLRNFWLCLLVGWRSDERLCRIWWRSCLRLRCSRCRWLIRWEISMSRSVLRLRVILCKGIWLWVKRRERIRWSWRRYRLVWLFLMLSMRLWLGCWRR